MEETSQYDRVLAYCAEAGVRCIRNRSLVVREEKQEKTESGLFLAEAYTPNPDRGKVVESDMFGEGETVYFRPYAETVLSLGPREDGLQVLVLHNDDILLWEEDGNETE